MNRWRCVLVGLLCTPVLALGQAPSSQPTERDPDVGRYGPRWGRPGRGPMRDYPPTDDQWAVVEEFMEKYSPTRLRAAQERMSAMQQASPRDSLGRWRTFVYSRYMALQRLRAENAKLYEQRVEMLKKEDEIWGLGADYARTTDLQQREKIKAELQRRIAALLADGLKEREERIENLQRALANEKERLEKDRANQDKMVSERLEQTLAQGDELAPADVLGGRGGRFGPTTQGSDGPRR